MMVAGSICQLPAAWGLPRVLPRSRCRSHCLSCWLLS